MRCLTLHTTINQCFFVVSNSGRRHLTESTLKLPKVAPVGPVDLMEELLCEVNMEMAAAEVAKSTTRIPGLIHSLHTSTLGILLRVCQGIIVVGHPRPQREAGLRLHRPTRTVTLLMGMHHRHNTSTTVGLHHPHHPHPTATTMGITTVITEISSLVPIIMVHLPMVGMVLTTTGMVDRDGRGMT